MLLHDRYYTHPLRAFVHTHLQDPTIKDEDLLSRAQSQGLKIHKFKRSSILPRVKKTLGFLYAFAPTELLDIGSGRGTFLWPLLDAFPELPVHCVELSDQRYTDLVAVAKGGVSQLHAHQMDVCQLAFPNNHFDGLTFLEVLEHLENPQAAAKEAVRVARRFILLSVPSKPDNNPEHIQFFQPNDLHEIFMAAGATSVKVQHVLNHRVAVIKV